MIWLYQAKASMNDNNLFPEVDSTRRSICGSGKVSFGQALFRSVNSTKTLHFAVFQFLAQISADFYAPLGIFVVKTNGDYGVRNRFC